MSNSWHSHLGLSWNVKIHLRRHYVFIRCPYIFLFLQTILMVALLLYCAVDIINYSDHQHWWSQQGQHKAMISWSVLPRQWHRPYRCNSVRVPYGSIQTFLFFWFQLYNWIRTGAVHQCNNHQIPLLHVHQSVTNLVMLMTLLLPLLQHFCDLIFLSILMELSVPSPKHTFKFMKSTELAFYFILPASPTKIPHCHCNTPINIPKPAPRIHLLYGYWICRKR